MRLPPEPTAGLRLLTGIVVYTGRPLLGLFLRAAIAARLRAANARALR